MNPERAFLPARSQIQQHNWGARRCPFRPASAVNSQQLLHLVLRTIPRG
jgi:hypothetical protein